MFFYSVHELASLRSYMNIVHIDALRIFMCISHHIQVLKIKCNIRFGFAIHPAVMGPIL